MKVVFSDTFPHVSVKDIIRPPFISVCLEQWLCVGDPRQPYFAFPVKPPASRRQLISSEELRFIARHGVEDEEESVLLELGEVAWLQPGRVMEVACWHLEFWLRSERVVDPG